MQVINTSFLFILAQKHNERQTMFFLLDQSLAGYLEGGINSDLKWYNDHLKLLSLEEHEHYSRVSGFPTHVIPQYERRVECELNSFENQ